MDKNKKKGFTLVELIVVLAILAILAAMLVPALTGYIDKANEKKTLATARQYYVAAQTVASEAYAEGVEIRYINWDGSSLKISVSDGNHNESYENVKDITDPNSKLLKDIVSLSELNNDDIAFFEFEDGTIYTANVVTKGKWAYYANGEWTVSKVPSLGGN